MSTTTNAAARYVLSDAALARTPGYDRLALWRISDVHGLLGLLELGPEPIPVGSEEEVCITPADDPRPGFLMVPFYWLVDASAGWYGYRNGQAVATYPTRWEADTGLAHRVVDSVAPITQPGQR